MPEFKIVSSVLDYSSTTINNILRRGSGAPRASSVHSVQDDSQLSAEQDPELKLPSLLSLVLVIAMNALTQISFFIIVSSSSKYAEYLGGTATFSGLVIGIPTVFSGMALIPVMKIDQGAYTRPIHFSCATMILGHILYGLAYKANYLYLILISRCVSGLAFTNFMYSKRFCSDPRIVGVRRRTTLAGWLVVGQGIGFSVGPFIGGLLYKIGFSNSVFNGYTSPGWLMAVIWLVFWGIFARFFQDVPRTRPNPPRAESPIQLNTPPFHPQIPVADEAGSGNSPPDLPSSLSNSITLRQWGVTVTMCWFAMTCFFTLGAWEANIPIFTAAVFDYSPFAAGNFIALGGISTFPLLFMNIYFVRRTQDRYILALGSSLGLLGLLTTLAILVTDRVTFGSLFACWFLVALGFNIASTVTMSLLSKQFPGEWNGRISMMIQYSNFTGRVLGAVWGGSGLRVGMVKYVGLEIAFLGLGGIMFLTLWRELKAKTG